MNIYIHHRKIHGADKRPREWRTGKHRLLVLVVAYSSRGVLAADAAGER